jgi:hypothetical protein
VRSNVGAALGNDMVVPLGDNMRGEFGGHCGGKRLKGAISVDDVWLDWWVRKREPEPRVAEEVRSWLFLLSGFLRGGWNDIFLRQ